MSNNIYSNDDLKSDDEKYAALEREMLEADAEEAGLSPNGPDHDQAVDQGQQRRPQQYQQHAQLEDYLDEPEAQQHYQQHIPDRESDPSGHFDSRIQRMEHMEQEAATRTFFEEADKRGQEEFGADYGRACDHVLKQRYGELERMYPNNRQTARLAAQYGFRSPQEYRQAIVQQDIMGVAQNAVQNGVQPEVAFYEIACQRGYKPTAPLTRSQRRALNDVVRAANSGDEKAGQRFDQVWDHLSDVGRL